MRLPMAGSPGAAGEGSTGPAGESGHDDGGPAAPPRKLEASALRLISTLAFAGAMAGLVIVLVHQWTQPRVQAHQARVLQEAIYEVLGGPERYETAFLLNGDFTTGPPPSADTASLERVYVGYDAGGRPMGVAVSGAKAGFQDVIRVLFGYDPVDGRVLGMKVLESKETPGLGDKIEKDSSFVAEFVGAATPLAGVKQGAGREENEIDMITGATISSRVIVDIINDRVDTLGEPLESWWSSGPVAAGVPRPADADDPGTGDGVAARAASPGGGGP